MYPKTELDQIVQRSENAVWCDLTDEVIVLQVSTGTYFGLSGVGCAVWHFIQVPRTLETILDHLVDRYTVEREVCESQTFAFLEEMAKHDLVTLSSSDAA